MSTDYESWIGRTELRKDVVTAAPAERLSATLDRDDPSPGEGDPLPPLSHWLFFLPREPQSGLGPDGHAMRGGFLPPVHALPRRMWAGGRLTFAGELIVGSKIERHSTIASVVSKQGKAGELVFVTVRHEIREAAGKTLVTEEHDIVYRGMGGAAVTEATPFVSDHAWERTLTPDPVLLFRFSALTFNGHRIHYDRDYVTRIEGYPGLVVHGPLIAMLLMDLARRNQPASRIREFSFRALAPVFDGRPLTLKGLPDPENRGALLWSENEMSGCTMKAEIKFADKSTGGSHA